MVKTGIIDFTAFLGKDNEVIIKELSIIDIASKCTQHWIFQPPQDQQQLMQSSWNNKTFDYHNNWMSTHYHGLYYTNGSSNYENLQSALINTCRNIQILFAPTVEKAKVLEDIFRDERVVIGLELFGCPQLPREPLFNLNLSEQENKYKSCLFHNIHAPGFYCTQSAVQKLAEWCENNEDKLDMNNAENRASTFVNWKLLSPTSKQLADEGFIRLTRTEDSTKCIYCGIVLHKWEEFDHPSEDHEFNSPFCRFVRYQAQEKEEEQRQKKKNEEKPSEGEDVCGCFETPKITQKELFDLCFA